MNNENTGSIIDALAIEKDKIEKNFPHDYLHREDWKQVAQKLLVNMVNESESAILSPLRISAEYRKTVPQKDQKVYIPSSFALFADKKSENITLATVDQVRINEEFPSDDNNRIFFTVKELDGHEFNWIYIQMHQQRYQQLYEKGNHLP